MQETRTDGTQFAMGKMGCRSGSWLVFVFVNVCLQCTLGFLGSPRIFVRDRSTPLIISGYESQRNAVVDGNNENDKVGNEVKHKHKHIHKHKNNDDDDDDDDEANDLYAGTDSRRAFLYGAVTVAATSFCPPTCRASVIGRSQSSIMEPIVSSNGSVESVSSTLALGTTPSSQKTTLEETISGAVAGGTLTVAKTVVKYPLDTATVRLQIPNTAYSIRDPIRLFRGAYTGILSPLLWNIPAGSIFFGVKDATKAAIKESVFGSVLPKWATTCLAVAAAQGPYWLVRNPSEVVKTIQQGNVTSSDTSSFDVFREIWNNGTSSTGNGNGLSGFYTGYVENILYAYPADVLKFLVYDTITGGKKKDVLSPLDGAVAGAVATAVAQYLTTPLDVVRNRIMVSTKSDQHKGINLDSDKA